MKNLSTVSMFAVIGLISCFEPITEAVVFAVEDNKAPVIVVSSPSESSTYMSSVTVEGYVKDDSLESGDNKGSLSSLSVSASSSRNHRGRITIGSDGSYNADTDFGEIAGDDFTYDSANRSFTAKFNTTDYRSQFMYLIITAVDRNGNESKKDLTLQRSAGPVIELTSPSSDAYNIDGDIVISGTVANSESQPGNDEIKTLTLNIPAINEYNVALDIGGGETSTELATRTSGTNLTFNRNSSIFTCAFSLWDSEKSNTPTLYITVTAEDKNGNIASKDATIRPRTPSPTILTNPSTSRTYYYSASSGISNPFYSPPVPSTSSTGDQPAEHTERLEFEGTVNLGSANSNPSLQIKFLNTATSLSNIGNVTLTRRSTSGSSVYSFNYPVRVGRNYKLESGAVRVRITLIASADDSSGNTFKTEMIWDIEEDSSPPEFNTFSTTKDTLSNTVTLRFKARDRGTGVDYSTLSGTSSGKSGADTLTFSGAGDFRSTDISLGTESQRVVNIGVGDIIGNTGSISTPELTSTSIASQRTGFPTAALPGDVVELTVVANKELNAAAFTATIAGVSASASVDPQHSETLIATATIPNDYTTTPIPFEITGFESVDGIPGIIMEIDNSTDGIHDSTNVVTCWPVLSTHDIDLEKGAGNTGNDPEVGDTVAVEFTTEANPLLSADPQVRLTVSLGMAGEMDLDVTKDDTVAAPDYRYTHTIVAEDLSGSTSANVEYTVRFPNESGTIFGDVETGTSTFELAPGP